MFSFNFYKNRHFFFSKNLPVYLHIIIDRLWIFPMNQIKRMYKKNLVNLNQHTFFQIRNQNCRESSSVYSGWAMSTAVRNLWTGRVPNITLPKSCPTGKDKHWSLDLPLSNHFYVTFTKESLHSVGGRGRGMGEGHLALGRVCLSFQNLWLIILLIPSQK